MAMRAGWEARVIFDGTPFAVKSWDMDSECTPLDASNTEGRPGNPLAANQAAKQFAATLAGLRRCRMSFRTATYDDTFPFGGPATFREGDFVTNVTVLPFAATVTPFAFESMMVTKVRIEGEIDGLQPVSLEGVSDGEFDWGF